MRSAPSSCPGIDMLVTVCASLFVEIPCLHINRFNVQVVVGTKGGTLELFDLPSATLLQSVQAHSGPIWGIDVRPDKGGLVTGSADKDVKFWDIRTREVAGEGSKILTRLGEERVVSTRL
jgi:WD40 repeat protein